MEVVEMKVGSTLL
jgi:hypothetical protein